MATLTERVIDIVDRHGREARRQVENLGRIEQVDGIPVPHTLHAAAQRLAVETGRTQHIGVEYFGETGEPFFENFPRGVQCRWLLGWTRDELIEQFHTVGIIWISPRKEASDV